MVDFFVEGFVDILRVKLEIFFVRRHICKFVLNLVVIHVFFLNPPVKSLVLHF